MTVPAITGPTDGADHGERPRGRVAVVEDHVLLAQTLGIALELRGIEVDIPPIDGPVVDRLRARPADLVLLDLELGPPVGDGTLLIAPLVQLGAQVLVVSSVTDEYRLGRTIEMGASGFLSKTQPVDVLIDTVLRAVRGEDILGAARRQELLSVVHSRRRTDRIRNQPFERLTEREREVLGALDQGMTVATIAEEWVVAPTTVRTHVRGILTKLGVTSQLEAVALARRQGARHLTDRAV